MCDLLYVRHRIACMECSTDNVPQGAAAMLTLHQKG